MTKDVIGSHGMRNRVAGFVSDTRSAMTALWRMLRTEFPDMTVVGCMDHCLDLFLKDCKDLMAVRSFLSCSLVAVLIACSCKNSRMQLRWLQVDEAIKIAAEIVNYFARNGLPNSLLIAQHKIHKART